MNTKVVLRFATISMARFDMFSVSSILYSHSFTCWITPVMPGDLLLTVDLLDIPPYGDPAKVKFYLTGLGLVLAKLISGERF
jgi:ABC-type antimicrobial peptide transport system permease subunit